MTHLTQIDHASELPPDQRYCTHCGKPLRGRFAWLEKDCRKLDVYYAEGGHIIPQDNSQGWFPFGLTCAKKLAR